MKTTTVTHDSRVVTPPKLNPPNQEIKLISMKNKNLFWMGLIRVR